MKYSFILLAIFCLSILKISAQELTEKENSMLDNFIKSKITLEKEKIVSDVLEKVFQGVVYRVKAGYSEENGISYCTDNIFIFKDGVLIECNGHNLSSAVRSNFSIKNEADANIFETALDKIYPVTRGDEELKEHLKKDNKWYFVRAKFFDSKSAYVVTIDPSGKITEIGYEMEAIKK